MNKKIVFVSGATSGIGKATSIKFGREGFSVVINGRRRDRLDELKSVLEDMGCSILSLPFDIMNRDEVQDAVKSMPEEWKHVDVLVNNAGLAVGMEHIDTGNPDDWDRMIDTNLKGLLWLTRALVPSMVKKGRGHIINLGSIAGKEIYENGNVYCATKHAVDALSRAMRIDLLKHGIKVTNVAPGLVETEFSMVRFKGDREKAALPYAGMKPLSGDDVADIIYYCATLPEHVNINDVVIMPAAQAGANHVVRKG
ncbi:MAG: SDR family NAD(P)-dependent oxidoreductase [Bacteroidales bacterium]|jgi:NADP-dependent 3-hydroxy acid dehydrogenase YdfG|nr:SDR family NAD(P)-dependent oxidoreductase [Bacteroidales bacterium]